MTSDLLIALGRMNLAIAASVLLVLILRPVTVRLFGAGVRYSLWGVVPAAAAAVLAPAAHRLVRLPASFHAPFAAAGPAAPSAGGLGWTQCLVMAWALGLVASLVLIAGRQRLFQREAAGQGPAIVGLIRPRIHLPSDFEARFSPAERDLILAHERCHLKRQDARVNGALALAQCAFWFNPAVHLGAWLARQDQEMACDEMVLARFPTARRVYAEALLKAQIASTGLPLGCYWPARGLLPLERRIKMLTTPARPPARRLAGGVVVALLATSCGYAAWAAQPAKIILIVIDASPFQSTMATTHKPGAAASATRTAHPAWTSLLEAQPAQADDAAIASSDESVDPADSTEPAIITATTSAKTDVDNPVPVASLGETPVPVIVAIQAEPLTLADAGLAKKTAAPRAAPLPSVAASPPHIRPALVFGEQYLETVAGGVPRWVVFRDVGRPF